MPDFRCPMLDGKTFKLSDYHGKYVVISFWASWCERCLAEMPALKVAYGALAGDNRIEMIGVSLDEQAEDAIRSVTKYELTWPQGLLTGGFDDTVAKMLGIQLIPSIWLIGPDGKILGKELAPESIRPILAKAIGNSPKS
jgi:peroxiredoxin